MAIVRRGEERALAPRELDPMRWMRQMTRELMRFDPFADIEPLVAPAGAAVFMPAFEVRETKDAYILKADLPGVREEDLDISVTGNRITTSGKREEEERHEDERYFVYERAYGAFTRTFTLPEGANPDQVRAEMKNGELTLVVPKRPEAQPKRVQVVAEKGAQPQQAQKAKA